MRMRRHFTSSFRLRNSNVELLDIGRRAGGEAVIDRDETGEIDVGGFQRTISWSSISLALNQ